MDAETMVDADVGNTDTLIAAGPEAGEKQPDNDKPESSGATDVNRQPNVVPSSQEQWETMKAMMAQLDVLTKALVPDPVVPTVRSKIVAGTIGVGPGDSPRKRKDYLDALEHVTRLKTKHFSGSTDPIVADEWRSRLVRNFNSTRCPEEYQKDIAVHFLEEEAHDWWVSVEKRTGGQVLTYADFEIEFNKKFFPPEAWDRLESEYLNLVQGVMTVRAYDVEFSRLRRFVGKEIEDEKAQVRRFIRGLRVDIRNHCVNGVFNSVVEVVERAAMIEAGIEEEKQLKREKVSSRSTHPAKTTDQKRKWDKVDNARSEPRYGECKTCGKYHSGSCWKTVGACGRCGSKDHEIRNCPRMDNGNGPRTCYLCGKEGHFKRECPKLDQRGNRGEETLPPPPKKQAVAPRVYELSEETADGNYRAITGM
ncbi:PREDICTED: uncharacterized protein LOC104783427 [Camelina sativa]|uniref:Uncharacterized protein LOC104783427 n=1 Tax=Camelina sativa TaxID=90675 RepID=A0ABM0YWH5_CAMSA|nr:PREDICTED: uncharacterized protein LOC104783427 [Camelina sativa]